MAALRSKSYISDAVCSPHLVQLLTQSPLGHINSTTQLSLPACADDLLKATDTAPLFTSGDEPSATLRHLINDLESADPNDSGLSEDEDNAAFGHRQLSGRWRPALSSWKDIGSCAQGLHLLGAILRVCKIARQICVERRIAVTPGGYLADMYFGEVIEVVWEHWKAAGGVSFPFLINQLLSLTTSVIDSPWSRKRNPR